MNIDTIRIVVAGIEVEIDRKAVKNLHLGVYPPDGRVRVAAPLAVSDDAVRLAVILRLAWVRRRRAKFRAQPRQSPRELVSGESHYVAGRRCRLRVAYHDGPPTFTLVGKATLELRVRPSVTAEKRRAALARWYRARLRSAAGPLVEKWAAALGVGVPAWEPRRMKTRWGSCDPAARRVRLNPELAKKPPLCLDYVVLHELAHLVERNHTDRFRTLLDEHMPNWRLVRDQLNSEPLGHEAWGR